MAEVFWQAILDNYEEIINIRPAIKILDILYYEMIKAYKEHVIDFEMTVGKINCISCDDSRVEVYITPLMISSKVKLMEELYNKRPDIFKNPDNYLTFYKYKPFNYKDKILRDIAYEDKILYVKELGVQIDYCYDEDFSQPKMTLAIAVKGKSQAIFEKKLVKFETETERELFLPQYGLMEMLLCNLIGEHNVMNYVGYMEFLLVDSLEGFNPITSLREEIKLVDKQPKNKYGRSLLQGE